MGYFYSSRIIIMIIAPALLSLFEIIRILTIKKRNGNVIYKSRDIKKGPIIMISTMGLFFLTMVFQAQHLKDLIFYLILFWIAIGGYIESTLSGFLRGIYVNAIISPGYNCDWSDIESVLFINNNIRFIHKEKGAFDFYIPFNSFERVKELVQKQIPNSI